MDTLQFFFGGRGILFLLFSFEFVKNIDELRSMSNLISGGCDVWSCVIFVSVVLSRDQFKTGRGTVIASGTGNKTIYA